MSIQTALSSAIRKERETSEVKELVALNPADDEHNPAHEQSQRNEFIHNGLSM